METYKEKLLDLLTHGADLIQLCDYLAGQIGTPVALTLPSRTIIAHSADYSEQLIYAFTNGLDMATEEEIHAIQSELDQRLLEGHAIVETWPYQKFKRIDCGCFYRGNLAAVIDVPIIHRIDIGGAVRMIEDSADVFITALRLNMYLSPSATQTMQIYLRSLLRNDLKIHQQTFARFPLLGKVAQWILVLVIPDSSEEWNEIQNTLSGFCTRLDSACFTMYEGNFALLADASLSSQITDFARSALTSCTFCIGIPYTDLSRTRARYEQACQIRYLAEHEGNTERILFVQKYKMPWVYLNYYANSHRDTPNPFYSFWKKYDEENGTEYFQTVRAYLLCGQDTRRMSEYLHVHKNTVNYRMRKISEIYPVDLKDCRIITDLYLSLYDEMIQISRPQQPVISRPAAPSHA